MFRYMSACAHGYTGISIHVHSTRMHVYIWMSLACVLIYQCIGAQWNMKPLVTGLWNQCHWNCQTIYMWPVISVMQHHVSINMQHRCLCISPRIKKGERTTCVQRLILHVKWRGCKRHMPEWKKTQIDIYASVKWIETFLLRCPV